MYGGFEKNVHGFYIFNMQLNKKKKFNFSRGHKIIFHRLFSRLLKFKIKIVYQVDTNIYARQFNKEFAKNITLAGELIGHTRFDVADSKRVMYAHVTRINSVSGKLHNLHFLTIR